jgi:hypothetical protein
LRPVDQLVWKLKEVYEKVFKKELNLKKGHETATTGRDGGKNNVAEVKKVREEQ